MEAQEFFVWCNGLHYYPTRDDSCRWSGYGADRGLHRFCNSRLPSGVRSYADLRDEGLTEREILQLLVVPANLVSEVEISCGAPAPASLAELVVARNGELLQLFPNGLLRVALSQGTQRHRVVYGRRRDAEANFWSLVDLAHLGQYEDVLDVPAGSTLLARVAADLGVTSAALEAALAGQEIDSIEVRAFELHHPWVPLGFDERLLVAGERDEQYRAANYPTIPPGHLVYLSYDVVDGAA